MSDDPKDPSEDPKEELKQGLGLIFRAAVKAASGIKKELDRSNLGKTIDDAGRELARAAGNVVERIGAEIKKAQPGEPRYGDPKNPRDPFAPEDKSMPTPGSEAKGPDAKPKGPTEEDPGFSIAGGSGDEPPKKDGPQ